MPVEFSRTAERAFLALDKPVRERMIKKLLEIQKNPGHFIEDLKGLPFDKIRVGDYRLFVKYDPLQDKLFIVDVRHRKLAYK